MAKTNTKNSANQLTLGDILHRISVPFLLFTAVLFGFLFLSANLILPKLTQLEIAGNGHNALELKAKVSDLGEKVDELEVARKEFVTPLREGSFGLVKIAKYDQVDSLAIQESLGEMRKRIVPEEDDAIHIEVLSHSLQKKTLRISGYVHNVGPRSMTILAQFVEELRDADWVESLEPPKFERKQSEDRGFYSPFDILINLK